MFKVVGRSHALVIRVGLRKPVARRGKFMTSDSSGDFASIPILDVSGFRKPGDAGLHAIAQELRAYLENVGFLYVRGHDVPRQSVEAVREASRRFHAQPLDKKLMLRLDKNFRGYIPINTSTIVTSSVAKVTKPNQSESLMLMHEVAADDPAALAGRPLQGPNQWPDESALPGFRAAIETYVAQMTGLARRMVEAITIALGMPSGSIARHFEKPTTFLRLLHYPTQREEDGLFGSAPHTDYGFITLLAQDDVGGLEVKNKAGEWIAAPPIPDTFVMNVGDILARWSNDKFVSTPHRVINRSGRERYSQPFFFDPAMETLVEVLPSCVPPGAEAKYAPVLYGDYLMERIDKNYQGRTKTASAA
jgi:isopenicillin N synthase-like dioxygenase